jgi:hypothetical protein
VCRLDEFGGSGSFLQNLAFPPCLPPVDIQLSENRGRLYDAPIIWLWHPVAVPLRKIVARCSQISAGSIRVSPSAIQLDRRMTVIRWQDEFFCCTKKSLHLAAWRRIHRMMSSTRGEYRPEALAPTAVMPVLFVESHEIRGHGDGSHQGGEYEI